jgi:solute carrier family 35 (UDP-sugar transporter), member A1/2/3
MASAHGANDAVRWCAGAGGIVVGLVMKYAGGVRKGFSIIGGILLTGFAQRLLYNAELSSAVVIALPIVLLSTFAHIRYPYVPAVEKKME